MLLLHYNPLYALLRFSLKVDEEKGCWPENWSAPLKTLKTRGRCVATEGMLIAAAPHLGKKRVCGTAHSRLITVSSVKLHVLALRLIVYIMTITTRGKAALKCACVVDTRDWWRAHTTHGAQAEPLTWHPRRHWGKVQTIAGGVASVSEHGADGSPRQTISGYLGPAKNPTSILFLARAKLDLWD